MSSRTPGMTSSGETAARAAASTSAYVAPARAASNIASQMSAIASGALSGRPDARWRRASSAAVKMRSRSSSHGVRRIEPIVATRRGPWSPPTRPGTPELPARGAPQPVDDPVTRDGSTAASSATGSTLARA